MARRAHSGLAGYRDASDFRTGGRNGRGRLAVNQAVTAQLDAIPDQPFTGCVREISALASTDFDGGWPLPRNFTLETALDQPDSRLKPGMTAQLTVIVDRIPNALAIPAQASFSARAGLWPMCGMVRSSRSACSKWAEGAAIASW